MKRITLRTARRRPELQAKFEGERVRIWSGEHLLWWRGGSGYTAEESEAAIFEWADAWARTSHCGDEKRITYVGVGK